MPSLIASVFNSVSRNSGIPLAGTSFDQAAGSASLFPVVQLQGVSNRTCPDNSHPVSSVHLLARLATSLPAWPKGLRIELFDGQRTQNMGSGVVAKALVIPVHDEHNGDFDGRNFTRNLVSRLSESDKRKLFTDVSVSGPLPDDTVLDAKLRLLLGEHLHRLLRADADLSQWVRSDGSNAFAKQVVIDLGVILSAFATLSGVSWAGQSDIADMQFPGLPRASSASTGPLAAMFLAGSITMGALAKLYQAQHRQPLDARAALIGVLFADRLNEKQRGILLEKVAPYIAGFTPALLVANVHKLLDSRPFDSVETVLQSLPVRDWARAMEHQRDAFDPSRVGNPTELAAAVENFVNAIWGAQAESGKPVVERLLNAVGVSVPARASYREISSLRRVEELKRESKQSGDLKLERESLELRQDIASMYGASVKQREAMERWEDRIKRKESIAKGRRGFIEKTGLHDTATNARGYQQAPVGTPVEKPSTVGQSLNTKTGTLPRESIPEHRGQVPLSLVPGALAGALTRPGRVVPSVETGPTVLSGAIAAALQPKPARLPVPFPAQAPQNTHNLALMSGRDYQRNLRRKALEEAIPGWMFANSTERQEVRNSLDGFAKLWPALIQLNKDVAAVPDGMADYLKEHVYAHLGLDIDPRNTTLLSLSWRTQEKWVMGSGHPVPTYSASDPEITTTRTNGFVAAKGNFQADEGLPVFLRESMTGQHLSVSREGADGEVVVIGPGATVSMRDWIELIRREDLGSVAQERLGDIMDEAKPTLLRSYPAALKASLATAKLGDFSARSAALLDQILEHPSLRPTTTSGRPWRVSPLQICGVESEAYVFHTAGLGGVASGDIHSDGGVLYLPNYGIWEFSNAGELGLKIKDMAKTPSELALLAERVPLDMRQTFDGCVAHAVEKNDLRLFQLGTGSALQGDLWQALYERERAFRLRNLKAIVRPTADLDVESTIKLRTAIYRSAMGMLGSFSGLPIVGPAFLGANLGDFANALFGYSQLRREQGASAADHLLEDIYGAAFGLLDFEPGDVPTLVKGGQHGDRTSVLPPYFKVSHAENMVLPPVDARGLMHVDQRVYARLENDDLVEMDVSEPTHPHAVARWLDIRVVGPELQRQADNRWSRNPDPVDSLSEVELLRRMRGEGPAPWRMEHMQHLIDDLGLDLATLRGIWDGLSPSGLLTEHIRRYQNLVDIDALPGVLKDELSPVPQNMQPVLAQALADLTGRPIEVYLPASESAEPVLKTRYKPGGTMGANASPVMVVERSGGEYIPYDPKQVSENVPTRLSLIDCVIDAVPGFGVNPSRWGAEQKSVRRDEVVDRAISRIEKERPAFLHMSLKQISAAPGSLDAQANGAGQVARVFPWMSEAMLRDVVAQLNGDSGMGLFDSGKAGRIASDALRHDILFRLLHGPHTTHSEAVYLNTLVADPGWPSGLAVEIIPAAVDLNSYLYPKAGAATRVYGDASSELRLQLYRRADGTYAPSEGGEHGTVPLSANHASDGLGHAVLDAMTTEQRDAWGSAHGPDIKLNEWVVERARGLDSEAFDGRMGQETTILKAGTLSDITPASISLDGRQVRQDGTYDIGGKIYLHAFGLTYRVKEDGGPGRYRIISADSLEDQSHASAYESLDFAPLMVRDRLGVWRRDTTDRLSLFSKLGAITQDVDVAQARVVLDITGVSTQQLRDIQLGRKDPSPELSDAITRARMRSVIGRLSRDADHFDSLQDPTVVVALLTKLKGWPGDTSIEVSDEDGYVSTYGQPGATKSVRVALEDLQSPILESLDDLFGTAFLESIIGEPQTPSIPVLERLGNAMSRAAASYPSYLFDAWYFKWDEPETMLSEQLMRQEPGLTKRTAEKILAEENITRQADLMPNGKLADKVKIRADEASRATRVQRLAEAVRTGRVVTTGEKNVVKHLLDRLPGWDDVIVNVDDVLSKPEDIYTGIWFALSPEDRQKLKLADVDAFRAAIWKQVEQDVDIFQRHSETVDGIQSSSCRVRRMAGEGDQASGCGTATIPQMAKDAKDVVIAVHGSVDRTSKRHSSASSSNSGSSVRSLNLGNSNIASLMVARPIKLNSRRDAVRFPKIDETNLAIQKPALVSRSSAAKESSSYIVFASGYDDAKLPTVDPKTSIFDQVDRHNKNGGVGVPGRRFKYQVQVAKGGRLVLNRPSDTEAALLEYVADQIETYLGSSSDSARPNLTGKLVIYTELAPCDSCQSIIRQFRARYPLIEMEVYYSFKGDRERTSTPLTDADVHFWSDRA